MYARIAALCAIATGAFAVASCAGSRDEPAVSFAPGTGTGARAPARAAGARSFAYEFGGGKIRHVIVIVQENRSIDNLFNGYKGVDSVQSGSGHGKTYKLRPLSMSVLHDVNHDHIQFLEDYDRGKMDGFDRLIHSSNPKCTDPRNQPSCWLFLGPPYNLEAYSVVPRSESAPYWTMARRYALGDRTFASNNGPSYVSHQYLIAGQANHVAENPGFPTPSPPPPPPLPWGCDAPPTQFVEVLKYGAASPPAFPKAVGVETPGPYPCFSYKTAADTLDAAGVSWAYYAPQIYGNGGDVWSAFDAIWPVRFGPDWVRDVKSPETRILNDIAGNSLPSVAWVVPAFVNSDHQGSGSTTGPQWVASIVNAVGQSPYWNSTAIVVLWDDWGGWYDHVAPPQYKDPQTGAFEGLGFRVPVLVISPYAKHGFVSHKQHEVASSLHLIEAVFGLPSLGGADARADYFADMFDFTQAPSKFAPIPTAMKAADFERQPPSREPPDW